MNAPTNIKAKPNEDRWTAATNAVGLWRGACLQSFAEAEEAVTETLLALGKVEGRGAMVKLRHLIGQRLEDLANAIGQNGPFATEGKMAAKALAEFRAYETLRAYLAHGVSRTAVERNSDWIALFRRVAIRARKDERETRTITKGEAQVIQQDLRRQVQSLCDTLRNLRAQFDASA